MLQNIRDNAQSTAAKVIVGLIVLTFALFGVESIVGNWGGEPEVATVNGEPITEREFQRAVELKRRQVINQMGDRFDPALLDEELLNKAVMDELINEKLLSQVVDELGLDVSEAMIGQQLRNVPEFQRDGQFDQALFRNAVGNMGMSPREFIQFARKNVKMAQLQNGITLSQFVTESEANRIAQINGEKRSADIYTIQLDALPDEPVTDEQVKAWYEAHKSDYKTTESMKVNYLLVDKGELAQQISVTEEEIRKEYEAVKDSLVAPEERHVAHILFEINEQQTQEQALEKAAEIVKKIKNGGDFAELAKQYSQDVGSAANGGDLGQLQKGVFPGAFEKAVERLEVGGVSDPVVTDYGVHVIKLLDKTESTAPSLASVRQKLETDLKNRKAQDKYAELTQRLSELAYESPDLAEPAEQLGLKIHEGLVLRTGGQGILGNPLVVKAAFSKEVRDEGLNSDVIEPGDGMTVVIHGIEYLPEREKTLEEAETEVKAALMADLKKTRAKKILTDLMSALKGGATLTQLKESSETFSSVQKESYEDITRADTRVPGSVREVLFSLQAPDNQVAFDLVDQSAAQVSLIALNAVKAQEPLTEDQIRQLKRAVTGQAGFRDFDAYLRSLKNTAEIERL